MKLLILCPYNFVEKPDEDDHYYYIHFSFTGSTPIIALGLLLHTVAYVLVYLTLPDGASNGPTYEVSYFRKPSLTIIVACAILLGTLLSSFATVFSKRKS